MLSEELLKQAVEELALALIDRLPEPEKCQHQFSEKFECKMQMLLLNIWADPQKNELTKKY